MDGTMTEFEENVSFDLDDPDFAPSSSRSMQSVLRNVNHANVSNNSDNKDSNDKDSNMQVTTANTENLSRQGSSLSLSCHSQYESSSTDDDAGLQESHPQYQDTFLTIEELRSQLNSCFTCGVSWNQEHVSLDCSECGGYSLQRPCPLCDGRCHAAWKRDLTMSHATGKARWIGECALSCGPSLEESLVPALEKLRATS